MPCAGDQIEAYSAGIETHGLNPSAVKVMAEADIDITAQKSQNVTEFANIPFDYVITVCGHAHENCPVFPQKARIIHVGFDDPPKLAQNIDDPEKQLDCYRKVRDQIKEYILTLPDPLIAQ